MLSLKYGISYSGSGTAEVKVSYNEGRLELIETLPSGEIYRHIVIGCLEDVNRIPNWSVKEAGIC